MFFCIAYFFFDLKIEQESGTNRVKLGFQTRNNSISSNEKKEFEKYGAQVQAKQGIPNQCYVVPAMIPHVESTYPQ
jgi:hypothetical protein